MMIINRGHYEIRCLQTCWKEQSEEAISTGGADSDTMVDTGSGIWFGGSLTRWKRDMKRY